MFRSIGLLLLLLWALPESASAQQGERPLQLFGYFQNQFQRQIEVEDAKVPGIINRVEQFDRTITSFSVQQLNLFLQKDLSQRWSTFINFEVLNNFSSSRRWGAYNLEEAWIKYRYDRRFSLRLGLQVPTFNNLNEIKNRTPLLPYIVRPLVYETSFNEIFSIDEYTPERAFVQTYGFFSPGPLKVDYALYVGNSPNINNWDDQNRKSEEQQTGIDTTATMLVGGRLGLRVNNLKGGVSLTRDFTNSFKGTEVLFGGPHDRFDELARTRLGADFSMTLSNFFLEAEYIQVSYHENDYPGTTSFNLSRAFYYVTLGYEFRERLQFYLSYWFIKERLVFLDNQDKAIITIPNVGLSYLVNDSIRLKAHYAYGKVDFEEHDTPPTTQTINILALAVSVVF